MSVVDAWVNHNPPHLAAGALQSPAASSLFDQFGGAEALMMQGVSEDQLIEEMRDAGIGQAILSTFSFVEDFAQLTKACETVAELVAREPSLFAGSGRIDVLRPTYRPAEAARAVESMIADFGFVAIRVVPGLIGRPADDRYLYPVYAKCVELRVPVTINVGQPGFLAPMEYQRPDALDRICLDFPDLVVVAAHMGFPWHDEILTMMQRHRNLHFMTSAWAPKYYPASVAKAIKSKRTRDRFIYASDYPLLPLARGIAEIESWGLEDETKRLFLGANARRVFGLSGGAANSPDAT